ncbi:MAG: hypothetical protein KDA84_23075, partial [Planctomycetaceae bacterium]|nr:hypothetical protein [Planctomycetaceae bacterium]
VSVGSEPQLPLLEDLLRPEPPPILETQPIPVNPDTIPAPAPMQPVNPADIPMPDLEEAL